MATAKIKDEPVDGQKISIFYKGLNDRNLTKRDAIKPSRITKNNKSIVLVDAKVMIQTLPLKLFQQTQV